MSCFEQSIFTKNHDVLDLGILAKACDELGWKYSLLHNSLTVTQVPHGASTHGEPVLTVTGNQIRWNRYYRSDGRALSNTVQQQYQKVYDEFQVQYALDAVLKAFSARGFTLIKDRHFQPNEKVKHRFWMKQLSKEKGEEKTATKILFEILHDGSVRTDSDYIPRDVHELADQAMDELGRMIGNERTIKPKPIPARYRHKAFCHPKNQITQNSK